MNRSNAGYQYLHGQKIAIMSFTFFIYFLTSGTLLFAQSTYPEAKLSKEDLFAHLSYLASDELMGRRTGQPGNDTAATYISQFFKTHGLQGMGDDGSFFQTISFEQTTIPREGKLTFDGHTYTQGDDMMILKGDPFDGKTQIVYAGHGLVDQENQIDDYAGVQAEGKIVVVLPGSPDAQDPLTISRLAPVKRKLAAERGAVAVIEIYRLGFPWSFFKQYFSRGGLELASGQDKDEFVSYGWIKEQSVGDLNSWIKTEEALSAAFEHSGARVDQLTSQNVIGLIEGTDPNLKNEYVILTGHYDHVGAGADGGGFYNEEDSIFNGARDNAMGTVAIMAAAKSISQQPTRRSVLVIALTGEEVGLLGSKYYVEHPVVPLDQSILNINTDGAGYNDTTVVSVIGHGRTGIDELIKDGANWAGLGIFPNPVPRQNLYDRSDNVSFAQKGVPAVNISPGITEFDDAIQYYYHQVTDEADTVSPSYLLQYAKSITRITRLIADSDKTPFWTEGDKYEEAGKKLYKLESE